VDRKGTRVDEEAHATIANGAHLAAQVVRQFEPGHPPVGLPATPDDESGVNQLPNESAYGIGATFSSSATWFTEMPGRRRKSRTSSSWDP